MSTYGESDVQFVTEYIHHGKYEHDSAVLIDPRYGLRDAVVTCLEESPYNSHVVDTDKVDKLVQELERDGYAELGWATYRIE